jgi:hypothetical protein
MFEFTAAPVHRCKATVSHGAGVPAVVTLPVRNEEATIVPCLDALANMTRGTVDLQEVILVLNGCTDETARVARRWGKGGRLPLTIVEVALPGSMNHAGGARACALTLALDALDRPDAIILTTDADSRVAPDWLLRAVTALDAGADVVAGEIGIDGACADWTAALRWRHGLENDYGALLDEIDAICDPLPHNPWPRHRRSSGAALAFRASALRRLPDLPAPACGEDRALVEACLAQDMRVRNDPRFRVQTSSRLVGRAHGGMADTLRRRSESITLPCDPLLEPCLQHVFRASTRAAARPVFRTGMSAAALAACLGLHAADARDLPCRHFGEAWQQLEPCAPALARMMLLPRDLPWEIGEARAWLACRSPVWTAEVAA